MPRLRISLDRTSVDNLQAQLIISQSIRHCEINLKGFYATWSLYGHNFFDISFNFSKVPPTTLCSDSPHGQNAS